MKNPTKCIYVFTVPSKFIQKASFLSHKTLTLTRNDLVINLSLLKSYLCQLRGTNIGHPTFNPTFGTFRATQCLINYHKKQND